MPGISPGEGLTLAVTAPEPGLGEEVPSDTDGEGEAAAADLVAEAPPNLPKPPAVPPVPALPPTSGAPPAPPPVAVPACEPSTSAGCAHGACRCR